MFILHKFLLHFLPMNIYGAGIAAVQNLRGRYFKSWPGAQRPMALCCGGYFSANGVLCISKSTCWKETKNQVMVKRQKTRKKTPQSINQVSCRFIYVPQWCIAGKVWNKEAVHSVKEVKVRAFKQTFGFTKSFASSLGWVGRSERSGGWPVWHTSAGRVRRRIQETTDTLLWP